MMWIGLALVIVAAAAALLIWIYLEASGILGHAVRALVAGKKIEANTRILRAIPDVNTLLDETDNAVAGIADKAGMLATALSAKDS
jgi:hypothetical protein